MRIPGRAAQFTLLLFAVAVLNATSSRMDSDQVGIICEFSQLPISAAGEITDVETASKELVNVLFGKNRTELGKRGFFSPSHFFFELAMQPEKTDLLPLFPVSQKLGRRLNLPDTTANRSYTLLAEKRGFLKTLAKNDVFSGLHLLPVEYMEVKHLGNQLQQYEAVRNIFRLGFSKNSFSQTLTEMILFLPDGLENYQNRMEGLSYDTKKVEKYLLIWETLVGCSQDYAIIPISKDSSVEFVTIESTVINSLNQGLFNCLPMWFAEFYDAYRDGDYLTAQRVLKSILDITPAVPAKPAYFNTTGILKIISVVFKTISMLGALAGIIFASIALYTSKKAGMLAIVLSVTAWACHLGWLIIEHRMGAGIALFQLPLLFSVFGLLPLIGIRYYRSASILGATLLVGAIILLQFKVPSLSGGMDSFESFSGWLVALTFVWQLAGVFAIGVIWQMGFSSAVIFWNSRIFDDDRLRLRQLMDVSLPLLRLAMLSLLFSMVMALVILLFTNEQFSIMNAVVASSLAMIFQCGLFLQLRWINRLDIIGLFRNHFTLLVLSLFLLMSFGDSTHAYFPDFFVTRFSPLVKQVVFIAGCTGIIIFHMLLFLPRIHQWVRNLRQPRKSAQGE